MTQRVVIVDDEELNVRLFRSIVTEINDVVVNAFTSSKDALAWLPGKDVDCFILDYHMPPPDGLEMIRLLRATDAYAMVPIVIVTGEHERDVRYRAFDAGANDFVRKPVDYRELVARLTTLLALQAAQKRLALQVGSLEASLLDSEERSREHAERLEALWRIANNPALNDDELVLAMLEAASTTIRAGQAFTGMLGRIEGTDLVTEAVAGAGNDPSSAAAIRVGNRVPVDRTIIAESIAAGGTRSWDDLLAGEKPRHTPGLAWRAVISTHFTAGGGTYALTFASTAPTVKSFGLQDHAYVEVLTAFFSTHLQQQWQAARIRHQLEHDSLTGLWNRSRFRSLGRAALRPGEPAAIAIIDMLNFHELNEAYGHLTGDAVLVEVAAALAAAAPEPEIVARVGGDSFAVFLPAAASRDWVLERVRGYGAVFDVPIGIGDREGKETVRAAGAIGVSLAPFDGTTFDELLFRAEARAGAAAASPEHLSFPA